MGDKNPEKWPCVLIDLGRAWKSCVELEVAGSERHKSCLVSHKGWHDVFQQSLGIGYSGQNATQVSQEWDTRK